jgi:hypothetical protein
MSQTERGRGGLFAHDNCSAHALLWMPCTQYIELQVSVNGQECNAARTRLQAAGQRYANHGAIFSGDGSRVQAAALAIGLALSWR